MTGSLASDWVSSSFLYGMSSQAIGYGSVAPFVLATINPGVLPPFIVYLYFYMYPLRFRFLSCLHDRFRVFILYYRLSFSSLCACAIGSGHLICIMFFVFFFYIFLRFAMAGDRCYLSNLMRCRCSLCTGTVDIIDFVNALLPSFPSLLRTPHRD